MKPFEWFYLAAEPFLPPLQKMVRGRLLRAALAASGTPEVLDVGGRKSHYTIGIPALVTVTDLPRETDLQERLHLGISPEIVARMGARRSNIRRVLLDDMTRSGLPDGAFDVVSAVEVLEHVAEDERFLAEVHRVLKPGGLFLMTTPNGDSVPVTNPDHKRHYRREQLRGLLASRYDEVRVEYAIRGGYFRGLGLRPWSIRRPWGTLLSMAGNVVNSVESSGSSLRDRPQGTRHLLALARKQA